MTPSTKREIKFRAWDEEIGQVIAVDYFQDGYAYYYDGKDEIQRCSARTLMQYTGLKDKNGKDIYEGDILDWPTKSVHEDGVVRYIENGFWLKNWEGKSHWPYNSTVIGNIYENPDLLTT
jgi:hypothetical protein